MSDSVVLVMGYNASGKSTVTNSYTDQGYHRLNRDKLGGSLAGLEQLLDDALSSGKRRVVMDNTYPSRDSRKGVIEVCRKHGVPAHCVLMGTSFEDAQLNAALRMVQRTGRLLMPEDFKKLNDPNLFPPAALFVYKKAFEKPSTAEGFASVHVEPFVRKYPDDWTNSALILDCDGVLRESTGQYQFPTKPEEVSVIKGRGDRVRQVASEFDYVLGVSNQSGVAKKQVTVADCEASFARTNELQGIAVEWHYCPHNVPPVTCYCRKPHSGLGALLMHKYKLDPRKCVYVGDQTTDDTFANRCGFKFIHERDFFK